VIRHAHCEMISIQRHNAGLYAMFMPNKLWWSLFFLISILHVCRSAIPKPNAAQYRYQENDFLALIHFNMGTFAHNGDPCCDETNWNTLAPFATGKTSDPATFNPELLNTDQWMESITALGANIAVLTAKHGCGFCLWPTKAKFKDGSAYNYNVGIEGAAIQKDVLRMFVNSAKKFKVGYGFYYSIMKNFYLCRSYVGKNSCTEKVLKNQRNISDDEYLSIARQQVTELWTEYGNLTRIWVDSGLGGLGDLMEKLQPNAAGNPSNPVGWCGTETGHPSEDCGGGPVWNTGGGFHGNLSQNYWEPKMCDPQLFVQHVWFWEPNLFVRTLRDLIPIYHDIVGRGMVMELAFSIDRYGLVEEKHAARYKELGEWVRECYGKPIASTNGTGSNFKIVLEYATFDRFQIKEAIEGGELVREFEIHIDRVGMGSNVLYRGQAIGRKRIVVLNEPITVSETTGLYLVIKEQIAPPNISQFAVFKQCRSG